MEYSWLPSSLVVKVIADKSGKPPIVLLIDDVVLLVADVSWANTGIEKTLQNNIKKSNKIVVFTLYLNTLDNK
jgi:hypothetical protein